MACQHRLVTKEIDRTVNEWLEKRREDFERLIAKNCVFLVNKDGKAVNLIPP